jgi:hypothetical protein
MSKAAKVIIVIIIVLLAVSVAVWAVQDRSGTDDQATLPVESSGGNQGVTPQNDTEDVEVAATITYTDNGFAVDNATVPAGSTILVVNQSQDVLDLTSNPHPTHEDQPELSVGIVDPGESRALVLTTPGTWGFHNHERDAHTGTITVQ